MKAETECKNSFIKVIGPATLENKVRPWSYAWTIYKYRTLNRRRSTWHGLETLQNHAGKWVVGKMVYGALNYVSYRMHTPRLSRHCAGNDPRVHRPLIERSWSPFDYLQILLSISVYWAYETEFGWEWPSIRVCRGLWTWFIAYVGPDAIILDNFVVPILILYFKGW